MVGRPENEATSQKRLGSRPSPIARIQHMCVSLFAAVATDLGNELFMAAAAVGHTMSSMVEQVASTQGTETARNMV